jgi:hypothetical protein
LTTSLVGTQCGKFLQFGKFVTTGYGHFILFLEDINLKAGLRAMPGIAEAARKTYHSALGTLTLTS